MLERVHLQPDLAAFESLIKARVARLSVFEDERFARPTRVERDPATGELTVLAEFITGSRLSDLLEATADAGIVPGVDVALGYLLDTLPALTLLHSTDGITHGLIDASRTVLTPDGQIVFLDPVFGSAVERLGLTRQRLWAKYGIASPAGDGLVHFDPAADIAQVALGTLALVLGRNLQPGEYPELLPSLLMEVIEVAQIRGSATFATGLQRFLQRSLPLPGRRPYASADEALSDVRQLVRRDIGVDVCRQAVVDFATQMDAAFGTAPAEDEDGKDTARQATERHAPGQNPRVPELDAFLDRRNHGATNEALATEAEHEALATEAHLEAASYAHAEAPADEDGNETELSLDNLESDSPATPARAVEEIYDLPPLDEVMAKATLLSRSAPQPAPAYREWEPIRFVEPEPVVTPAIDDAYQPEPADTAGHFPDQEVVEELATTEPYVPVDDAPLLDAPAPVVEDVPAEPIAATPHVAAPTSSVPEPVPVEPPEPVAPEAAAQADTEGEAGPDKDSASSRRRKRQQQKSARARKDKLRSTTADQKTPPPPVPVPVSRSRARTPREPDGLARLAAAGSAVRTAGASADARPAADRRAAAGADSTCAARRAGSSLVCTDAGRVLATTGLPVERVVIIGVRHAGRAPADAARTTRTATHSARAAADAAGETETRATNWLRAAPTDICGIPADPRSCRAIRHSRPRPQSAGSRDEPRAFPWKLAAVAVAVAAIAIFLGRSYLPGRTAVSGEPGAVVETPAATLTPPTQADDSPIPAGRGRIVVVTQPPGIKVLLDRKAVGETPLRIDVTPGRRMLTFLTSGGEVIRSVRVAAGKTETLDLPVFSGWVAVFAPIVLHVAADGKSIGTTEENRLMLPPGKHQLTVTNRELGYTATQEVVIEPGEVKTVNIEPRGTVNLNAIPWAEVWLDGQKLGDTPLADTVVPLGLREFVFKNPQFGERKIGATIKATPNPPVVVDFTK